MPATPRALATPIRRAVAKAAQAAAERWVASESRVTRKTSAPTNAAQPAASTPICSFRSTAPSAMTRDRRFATERNAQGKVVVVVVELVDVVGGHVVVVPQQP